MKNIFITGIGSGLGKAFAEYYLNKGYKVFALSRHLPENLKEKPHLKFQYCDLLALENVYNATYQLLKEIQEIELVILNAGLLTELKEIHKTPIYEMKNMMDINVWANKIILDCLIDLKLNIKQVIGISSGASVNGSKGWHGYSISKAALNMLIKLYSREMENTHLIALAPGLILTPMLEKFVLSADENKFPSVKRIKTAPKMNPEEAAKKIDEIRQKLFEFESGSYVDIRNL